METLIIDEDLTENNITDDILNIGLKMKVSLYNNFKLIKYNNIDIYVTPINSRIYNGYIYLKAHRDEDEPAVIYRDDEGNISLKLYVKNGIIGRKNNKPAVISYYENLYIWFINGQMKRTDNGPIEINPEEYIWYNRSTGTKERIKRSNELDKIYLKNI